MGEKNYSVANLHSATRSSGSSAPISTKFCVRVAFWDLGRDSDDPPAYTARPRYYHPKLDSFFANHIACANSTRSNTDRSQRKASEI